MDRVTHLMRQQAIRPSAELIAACLDGLRTFVKGNSTTDDLTLLAIRRSG